MTNQDKTEYDAALKFIDLPRCIKCEHYQTGGGKGACVKHGEIPTEYLYTPNECGDYTDGVPF